MKMRIVCLIRFLAPHRRIDKANCFTDTTSSTASGIATVLRYTPFALNFAMSEMQPILGKN